MWQLTPTALDTLNANLQQLAQEHGIPIRKVKISNSFIKIAMLKAPQWTSKEAD